MSSASVVWSARLTLAIFWILLSILMIGPFEGLLQSFTLGDKEVHVLAFFAVTLLSFVAAPKMRRNDLAIAALFLGGGFELAQAVAGRNGDITDFAANALGVLMAWGPSHIASVRRKARSRRSDRRRRARAPGQPQLPVRPLAGAEQADGRSGVAA